MLMMMVGFGWYTVYRERGWFQVVEMNRYRGVQQRTVNYQESGIVRTVLRTGIDERALSPTSITASINALLPTGDPKTLAVCEF